METAFNNRSGRVIALGRFAIAAVFCGAVLLDPSQPSRFPTAAYAILGIYAALAGTHLMTSWNDWWIEARVSRLMHMVDIAMFGSIVFLTDGYTSPFFTLFAFIILSATVKWGWRETAATAAAVIALFLLAGLAAYRWADGEVEIVQLLVRGTHLVVLSLVLIWFGINQPIGSIRRPEPLELGDDGPAGDPPVRPAMEHARAALGAERIIFAWWERDEPYATCDTLAGGAFERTGFGPGDTGELVHPRLAERPFLFDTRRRRALTRDANGSLVMARDETWVDANFAGRYLADQGIAIPIRSNIYEGVLFAAGISGMCSDDLAQAEELGTEIAAALDRSAALRLTEETAAARTRLSLARDLHDSVVQLLAGVAFRLQGMRRTLAGGGDPDRDLEDLQEELRLEREHLRDFIGLLRDQPRADDKAGFAAALRQLTERLARQWGVECELIRCPESLKLPPNLRHDLQQLVREGVANAVRHGGADHITVSLAEGATGLSLVVADNGSGFVLEGGNGPKPWSLSERVRSVGGDLRLHSSERGSRVIMSIPVEMQP